MNKAIARKIEMTQLFDELGIVTPVTWLKFEPAVVVRLKSQEKDGYVAVQVGYGESKPGHTTRPVAGQIKGLDSHPRRFAEERMDSVEDYSVGQVFNPTEVFHTGDMVDVRAMSKGKGFQGGVKRWGFAGGPKTHGQSDRHRAPGSIGSGTFPAKVWKGLHMAGHMGHKYITTQGLRVMAVEGDRIALKGAVPGARSTLVTIAKKG